MNALGTIGWPVIDRIHFGGSFAISPHGVFIAFGFLLGAWWLLREGPKRGLSVDHINTMLFWALIGAVVGARVFYVIGHFSEFNGIYDMLAVWRGGITLLGGIIGAVVINVPIVKHYGYRFFQVMDPAALALAFGLWVGRLGDLIIGDHLGKPTSWALAFVYHGGNLAGYSCTAGTCTASLEGARTMVITRAGATLLNQTGQVLERGAGVHQTALYDMISSSILFVLLYWMNRRPRREGILFCTFLIWYGVQRITTDFLRVDKTVLGMTGSQWTSVAAVIVAIALLIKWAIDAKRKGPLDPRPSTFFVPPAMPGR